MRLGLPLLLSVLTAGPVAAQWDPAPFRPWAYRDQQQHIAAGAALDLVVRGPWIAKPYRDTWWKRITVVAVIGAAYEGLQMYEAHVNGQRGHGWGWSWADLGCDVLGAAAVELVDAIL